MYIDEQQEEKCFSQQLEEIRIKKNISQSEIAKKLNCSRNNVNSRLNSPSISENLLKRIADSMGCYVKLIIIDKETNKPL